MKQRWINLLAVLGLAWLGVSPVLAAPASALVPVDQAVDDIDHLSRSLRQVQVGLRADGEQTSLFRLSPAQRGLAEQAPAKYLRIGPGFRAYTHQLDYVVPVHKLKDRIEYRSNITPVVDGLFVEVVRLDVVYDLRPVQPRSLVQQTTPQPEPRPLPDPRVQTRIYGTVEGQVNGQINGRIDARVNSQPADRRMPQVGDVRGNRIENPNTRVDP